MSDPNLDRLARSREFGATHLPRNDEELAEFISAATSDRGVDVAIDFAGVPQAVEKSLAYVRQGGV